MSDLENKNAYDDEVRRPDHEARRREIRRATAAPKGWRVVFGVLMIVIYIGMGILCLTGFFGTTGIWSWLRWVAGALFTVYGIWRGYRQFVLTD